jgi:hypothetical protein
MLADLGPHAMWDEPLVGALFGDFYNAEKAEERVDRFILAPAYRATWQAGIREMVLDGAAVRFPDLPRSARLFIKEPNGSTGAPLLSAALPESSIIVLIRDPRDVAASVIAGQRAGGWATALPHNPVHKTAQAEADPEAFLRDVAEQYVDVVERLAATYETHPGPKILVTYEDLRAEPLDEMSRICEALGVGAQGDELSRVVEHRSWERVPKDVKGQAKIFRKATPGSWRNDLTAEQSTLIETITAPVLSKFYPP